MLVQETIDHGNYRNVRQVELSDMRPSTLARMVRDCPYVVNRPEHILSALGMALSSGGSYSHGWTTWETVSHAGTGGGGGMTVHLHARGPLFPGDMVCRVECGLECGSRETTAYRNLDPERVTCPECLRLAGDSSATS